MKYLIGCESSGRVRDALIARGVDAVSCDLEPSETPGPHIQADLFEVIDEGSWDVLIAFWPCTHVAVSGAKHFARKRLRQARDVACFKLLMECGIPLIAMENPIGRLSTLYRKPDQIIQPWQFGHPQFKATCLWLKGFPRLQPTNILTPPVRGTGDYKRWSVVHREPPGPNRARNRSRTFSGIAGAIADQWSNANEWSLTA